MSIKNYTLFIFTASSLLPVFANFREEPVWKKVLIYNIQIQEI